MKWEVQDVRDAVPEGRFHLILCRNLAFTYFEEALQRAQPYRDVIGAFDAALASEASLKLPAFTDPLFFGGSTTGASILTAGLLAFGAVSFWALEWDEAVAREPLGTKLLMGLFHSTTCRKIGRAHV